MPRQSGKAAAELERARQADQLIQLVIAGQSVAKAADSLKISYEVAKRMYRQALQKTFDESTDQRQELLGRELKTLEMLQRALWPGALRGHVRSVEVMLAVMDRRSKYLGFDAATKVQVEFARVDQALSDITKIIDGEATAQAATLLRIEPGQP